MARQLEEMWEYAQSIADEEDTDPTPPDFKKVDKEKVEKAAQKINKILKGNPKARLKCTDQFIVNYTLHQDTNDIHTLRPHLENHEHLYQNLPETLTADAGYGSQENYELL